MDASAKYGSFYLQMQDLECSTQIMFEILHNFFQIIQRRLSKRENSFLSTISEFVYAAEGSRILATFPQKTFQPRGTFLAREYALLHIGRDGGRRRDLGQYLFKGSEAAS